MPEQAAKGLKRDITPLVQLCARLDVNPIGIDRVQEQFGDFDIFWGAVMNGPPSELQMYAGVFLWQRLTTGFPMNQLMRAAKAEEEDRIEKARGAEMIDLGNGVMFVQSTVFGWDQWYLAQVEDMPGLPSSWKHPVVVACVAIKEGISVGCPNPEVAEALFGKGGLIPVVQAGSRRSARFRRR
jgi:hypothetical protein